MRRERVVALGGIATLFVLLVGCVSIDPPPVGGVGDGAFCGEGDLRLALPQVASSCEAVFSTLPEAQSAQFGCEMKSGVPQLCVPRGYCGPLATPELMLDGFRCVPIPPPAAGVDAAALQLASAIAIDGAARVLSEWDGGANTFGTVAVPAKSSVSGSELGQLLQRYIAAVDAADADLLRIVADDILALSERYEREVSLRETEVLELVVLDALLQSGLDDRAAQPDLERVCAIVEGLPAASDAGDGWMRDRVLVDWLIALELDAHVGRGVGSPLMEQLLEALSREHVFSLFLARFEDEDFAILSEQHQRAVYRAFDRAVVSRQPLTAQSLAVLRAAVEQRVVRASIVDARVSTEDSATELAPLLRVLDAARVGGSGDNEVWGEGEYLRGMVSYRLFAQTGDLAHCRAAMAGFNESIRVLEGTGNKYPRLARVHLREMRGAGVLTCFL